MTGVPTFDLTAEPWIPVLDLDGTERLLSVREVFEQADDLATIGGELPTTGFALTRLLLAVLHRAVHGPRDPDHWQELWEADGLPAREVRAYLDGCRDRWDLLHPATPFLQVAGLRSARGDVSPLSKLIADVPNGAPLFTTRGNRWLQRVSAAEAARWLVHAHAFDTSGIKTGVIGDDRASGGKCYPLGVAWPGRVGGVFVEGSTVRQTLLLNLVPYAANLPLQWSTPGQDLPVWERAPLGPGPELDPDGFVRTRPFGPADLYSWPSRHLRLVGDGEGVTGVVLTYANPLPQQNAHTFEPMCAWRRSPTQEKARNEALVYMPRSHDPERVFWRGLGALLPARGTGSSRQDPAAGLGATVLAWLADAQYSELLPREQRVRTRIVGIAYGTQDSAVDEIVDDQVSTQVAVLSAEDGALGRAAIDAAGRADAAVMALKNLASNVVRAAGGDGDGARARTEEIAFAALDVPFRRWLAQLTVDADRVALRAAWEAEVRRHVEALALDIVEQAGPAAWSGRQVMGRHVDAGLAEVWFRTALRKELVYAFPRPVAAGIPALEGTPV